MNCILVLIYFVGYILICIYMKQMDLGFSFILCYLEISTISNEPITLAKRNHV